MTFVLFYHSALSDWNHGSAHFLRGVAVELQARGHRVVIHEPADSWSATSLVADHGRAALGATTRAYPTLIVERDREPVDLEAALDGADVVIVHEWNSHELIRRIGAHRRRHRYLLLFHDTHHRSISNVASMAAYDLSEYDGVLALGEVIRQRYLERGWAQRAWTWHEAADTRLFGPRPRLKRARDLVWIANWGDDERSSEVREFLIEPARALALRTTLHGVRYPSEALCEMEQAGLTYRGWLPNYRVPDVFARHRVTVHIPRRPYVTTLPGVPTIRPFEAMACGIPLISAPWLDDEHLFRPGEDYLVARNGAEMRSHLRDVLGDPLLADRLAVSGLQSIRARHTCAHRVDELLGVVEAQAPAIFAAGPAITL